MNKTVKLYNSSITLHFSDTARNRYTIEETGKSPVGVTTVLQTLNKPALMTWPMNEALASVRTYINNTSSVNFDLESMIDFASKAYLKKSDKGKDTGTAVHSAIEFFLNLEDKSEKSQAVYFAGVLATQPLEVGKAVSAFLDWYVDGAKPKALAVEEIVYSKKYDYAGTYDGLLEIGGKIVLMDIKTTNSSRTAPLGIYPEMFLQLGAYSLAHLEDNPLETIDELMIIRVGKDGVVNTLKASELGLTIKQCQDSFVAVLQAYKFLTPLAKKIAEKKA